MDLETIILNNGLKMPIIGSGTNTFGKEGNQYSGALRGDVQEMEWAIENGYRHFDSAQIYFNEEVVGRGIQQSEMPREEFFITTKLNTYNGYPGDEAVHASIKSSLQKLQVETIDLFLIHFPWDNDEEIIRAWKILEDYYEQGIFKSIGVSNFNQEQLTLIFDHGQVKPAVNQIESHLGHWQNNLIEFHKENDIVTVAWSPLKGIQDDYPVVTELAKKYNKSVAQIVLRYQIQRGVVVIPKSHNKARQKESLMLFGFELAEEEMKKISNL